MKLKGLLRYNILIIGLMLLGCSSGSEKTNEVEWETDPVKEEPSRTASETLPFDRTTWQNPMLVLDKLGNIEGKHIADIGAGMGYFTFLLAEKGATVLAIDIESEFLDYIESRRDASALYTSEMIETRLSNPADPLLNAREVDVALLVNTFAFLPSQIDYLKKIDQGIKRNGILCIVDYKSEDVPVISANTPVLPLLNVQEALEGAGFEVISVDTTSLEYQYIITATRP